MKKPLIEITDAKGGMTLNEKLGRSDQFYIGKQIDFSSKPGKITCDRNWENMEYSSSIDMPALFYDICVTSGHDVYFGGSDTIVYKQDTIGSIVLAHDSANTGAIQELKQYNGYLYFAQDTTIGRYDLTSTWDDSWQTGLNNAPHPMKVSADKKLYIGNGQYVSSWDDATFTSNALDLGSNWEVQTLDDFGWRYLAIGASRLDSSGQPLEAKIFLWNRTSSSWNDEIRIPENNISAMIFAGGYLWYWAGESANLYVTPDASRVSNKILSFKKEKENNLIVYRNAVTMRRGTIYFALSDTNPTTDFGLDVHPNNPTGIYSFPVNPANFSLNIPYRLYDLVETYRSLRQVYNSDSSNMLYFSLSTYTGFSTIKRLMRESTSSATENLYGGTGTYESFKFEVPTGKRMITEYFGVECDPLPANTLFSLSYKKDGDTSWTSVISNFQTDNATEKKVLKRIRAKSLQLRLDISGGGTFNRPFIKKVYVTGHLENV